MNEEMGARPPEEESGVQSDGGVFPIAAKPVRVTPKTAIGSRLRDHLANERTELAWIRTGVALIALGIAIDKFLIAQHESGVLVGTLVVLSGLFAIVYSTIHYVVVQRRIERDVYKPNFVGPLVLATALTIGGILALVWMS